MQNRHYPVFYHLSNRPQKEALYPALAKHGCREWMDRQTVYTGLAQSLYHHLTEPGNGEMSHPQSLWAELLGQAIFFGWNMAEGSCPMNQHQVLWANGDLSRNAGDLLRTSGKLPALVGQYAPPDLENLGHSSLSSRTPSCPIFAAKGQPPACLIAVIRVSFPAGPGMAIMHPPPPAPVIFAPSAPPAPRQA